MVDEEDKVDVFLLHYTELVTHTYDNRKVFDFEIASWSQASVDEEILSSNYRVYPGDGDIVLNFATSTEVEHWEEYVAFGYTQWMTGMGGLLSITTAVFFWVSYLIAILFGDGIGMGILPGLSFNFSSYEHVHWMIARLRDKKAI